MGEARRRATTTLISVLIPERGRPGPLDRLIRSLLDTMDGDARVEILVAIDDDDPAWEGREASPHAQTTYHRWPRPITLGEKINFLAKRAEGDIFLFLANDQVMTTFGWPTLIRDAVAKLPNGIGIPYLRDPAHPGHASYPVITRRLATAIGFVMPPWPPYWFIDTWWDEIGILLDVRHEIPVEVASPDGRGKTHGLTDLGFWVDWFNATRPLRMRDAVNLATTAFGDAGAQAVAERIGERAALCVERTRHMSSPAFLEHWSDNAESPPPPRYAQIKAYAEDLMKDLAREAPRRLRVAICTPSGRQIEATTATCIAGLAVHSANHGMDVALLNIQTSDICHGRNSTVEIAILQQNCDYLLWIDSDMKFPSDTLVRLLKHGKDIVGATYNKRVKNKDGKYETLGRFAGDRPTVVGPGLHEALLLPGGLMLVKADVYRKIGWPYYSTSFRFPGNDGLDRLKSLLRSYFYEAPPEPLLAELDGTGFGAWMRDHYVLGEGGADFPTFSEDLWFCRRARREGYQVWCDLDLTFQVAHLGEIEVTCLPVAQEAAKEAAQEAA